MGYKYKPNKSVAKRFKVTGTGKLKHHHTLTSHLRSSRSGNKKRHLRRSAVLAEGMAKSMRNMMGLTGVRPAQVRHRRELAARRKAQAVAAASAPVAA